MASKSDPLGDRMKAYERRETEHRFMRFAPVIARMDGRGFRKWTAGLTRPYDENLSKVMIEVTRSLVAETGARVGYTQSDEITLVIMVDEINQSLMFDGKAQKLCSSLASATTSLFIRHCILKGGEELAKRALKDPRFDARVFQVPNREEAANAVLWREQDASRNAVSMAARSLHPHGELQGRNGREMQEMILQKGQAFDDYPSFFRRGSFLQARERVEPLPEDVRARLGIDADHEQAVVTRRSIERIEMPSFSSVINRVEVIFEGLEPEVASD